MPSEGYNVGYSKSGTIGTTATQLDSTARNLLHGILIKNDDDEGTANIFVGFTNAVTAGTDGTATNGFRIGAGQAISVEPKLVNQVWLISDTAGTVWYAIGG